MVVGMKSLLASMRASASDKLSEIKAVTYKDTFGAVARRAYNYSKRVLTLEGIVSSKADNPSTADVALAKAIAVDVMNNGWDGAGQVMNKIFSIFTGVNMNSKEVGISCRVELPKGTFVKTHMGKVGIISEGSNLFVMKGSSFEKDTTFSSYNQKIDLPTEDEITIFLGTIMSDPSKMRQVASRLKIGTLQEFENMLAISENGLDVENDDQMEYKKYFIGNFNPDITQGVAV